MDVLLQEKIKYSTGIRRRIIFVFATFTIFVLIATFSFSRFWLSSFHEEADTNVLKAGYNSLIFYFDVRRSLINELAQSYSERDDVLRIASGQKVVLSPEFFVFLKEKYGLDSLVILDAEKEVKLGNAGFLTANFNAKLAGLLASNNSVSGFWQTPDDNLWFFGSAPIFEKGKSGRQGTIALAFLVDDRVVENFRKSLGLDVAFIHNASFFLNSRAFPDSGSAENSLYGSWKKLQYTQLPYNIQKISKQSILGKLFLDSLLRDFQGDPVGILRISDPHESLMFPQKNILFLLCLIFILLCISFYLTIKFLTNHITQPLVRLMTAIKDITDSGKLSNRLKIQFDDEVGGLAVEFNAMLDSLEKLDNKVKNSGKELSALYNDLLEQKRFASEMLNLAPSIILMLLPDGKIKYVNEAVEAITGFKVEESVGRFWVEQFVPYSSKGQFKEILDGILRGDLEPYRQKEFPVITKDGKERLLLWNNSLLKNSDGDVTAIISVCQDITELKQMQIDMLGKVNELERFYRVTMDREKVILSLKHELQDIKSKMSELEEKRGKPK